MVTKEQLNKQRYLKELERCELVSKKIQESLQHIR